MDTCSQTQKVDKKHTHTQASNKTYSERQGKKKKKNTSSNLCNYTVCLTTDFCYPLSVLKSET